MIALLKAGADHTDAMVRPFAAVSTQTDQTAEPTAPLDGHDGTAAMLAADPHVAQLERQVEELTAQLASATLAAEAREEEAYGRGEQAGRAQADTLAQERLEAFRETLSAARAAHAGQLEALEVLSLEVAQTVLSRILGDRLHYAPMVAEAVSHQIAQLDHALITQVRVSPGDFPDGQALAACAAQIPEIALLRDPTLAPGDCRIDLVLGNVEAGLPGQWARAAELLESMAETGNMP